MFGRENWEPAEGKIIEAQLKFNTVQSQGRRSNFIVEVRPLSGAATFRTELKAHFENFADLYNGYIVKMECDVKRQKARWDMSDPQINYSLQEKAKKEREKERRAAALTGDTSDEAPSAD